MTLRSAQTPAIILKRVNTGEMDRVVTLYTRDFGKIAVIAKGSRKLSSSRLGSLEPGNHIDAYLINTKQMPILTQVRILQEYQRVKETLLGLKRMLQVLEIVDCLTVEEAQPELFDQLSDILMTLNNSPQQYSSVRTRLISMVEELGYSTHDLNKGSFSEFVENITERPLRSYSYLTVKS